MKRRSKDMSCLQRGVTVVAGSFTLLCVGPESYAASQQLVSLSISPFLLVLFPLPLFWKFGFQFPVDETWRDAPAVGC